MYSISVFLSFVLAAATARADVEKPFIQCGEVGYNDPTSCPPGYTCVPLEGQDPVCVPLPSSVGPTLVTVSTFTVATTTPTAPDITRRARLNRRARLRGRAKLTTTKKTKTKTKKSTTPGVNSTPKVNPTPTVNLTPTGLTTIFPTPTGTIYSSAAITIKSNQDFDGKMALYDRDPPICGVKKDGSDDKKEGQDPDAMFVLEDGAILSNVIIGKHQREGIHCQGECTLNNVWWDDVCEDAVTFRQSSGNSYINGGGARDASDKVIQHDGFGCINVKNFFADRIGKLYRSCGNCAGNGRPRCVTMKNIFATNYVTCLIGINEIYGDTALIQDSRVDNINKVCDLYQGNNVGGPAVRELDADEKSKRCTERNIIQI